MLHAAVIEQAVADEQMALIDTASVDGEGRHEGRLRGRQGLQQGIGDRPDIALGRGIERRAVLEEQLARALGFQPFKRRERFTDRLIHRAAARLERDHHGVDLSQIQPVRRPFLQRVLGYPDHLHGAHAGTYQVVGKIRRAGEVIGDSAQYDRHHCAPSSFAAGRLKLPRR